ncbi:MAG: hypothetical protein MZU84_03355 [Sphingobacterium sp.]|nr:hypothetical protein [Sphingobacterium sp.]
MRAIDSEKERLESISASVLMRIYGKREAMLLDEVCCDVAFEQHIGPWLDDDHESEDWDLRYTEIAMLSPWDLKRRVKRETRKLIDRWLLEKAEQIVMIDEQIRAQEETAYRVLLHKLMQAA